MSDNKLLYKLKDLLAEVKERAKGIAEIKDVNNLNETDYSEIGENIGNVLRDLLPILYAKKNPNLKYYLGNQLYNKSKTKDVTRGQAGEKYNIDSRILRNWFELIEKGDINSLNKLIRSSDVASRLAVYCGYVGWKGFKSISIKNFLKASQNTYEKFKAENEIDGNPSVEFSKNLQLIEKYVTEKFHKASSYNLTTRESFTILDKINVTIDKLHELVSFIDYSIPLSAKDEYLKKLFFSIIETKNLTPANKELIYLFIENKREEWQWYHQSMLASALSISIIRNYDDIKVDCLIKLISKTIQNPHLDVWIKALIGIILGFQKIYNDKTRLSNVKSKLQSISFANKEARNTIFFIIQKIVSYRFVDLDEKILKTSYFNEPHKHFIPFHKDTDLLKVSFKKNSQNIDTDYFSELLSGSVSLSNFQKYQIAFTYSMLKKEEIHKIIKVLEQEVQDNSYLENHYYNSTLGTLSYRLLDEFCFSISYLPELSDVRIDDLSKTQHEKERFIQIVSELFDIRFLIGDIHLKKDNIEAALVCYLNEDKIFPNNVLTLNQIGLCYYELGNFNKALEYFGKSNDIFPNNFWVLSHIAHTFTSLKEYETALYYYFKAFDIESNDVYNLAQIGECLIKTDNNELALNVYKSLNKAIPKNENILKKIANIYQDLGNFKSALDYYLEVEEVRPGSDLNLTDIGWCYFIIGDLILAKEYNLKVIEGGVDSKYALMNMGHIYLCNKNFDKAFNYYQKSLVAWECSIEFFNSLNKDFQHIKPYGISKGDFEEINLKLEELCKEKSKLRD